MMFRKNNRGDFFPLLQNIVSHSEQSRTLLFLGDAGWGKTACALDLAQIILQENPLTSSSFFYFRNDLFSLKTEFFLTKSPNTEEAWTWLRLLQRRINMSGAIDENLTIPVGVKLPQLKEQLEEYISFPSFPSDEKFINQLISVAHVLTKKSGIPINVIREAIKFHSMQSMGRVSILADFDTADSTTQNSALKLIEEPHPNHWVIITAQNEKTILPTILSRALKITFKKPLASDFEFLSPNPHHYISSIDIMKESLYKLSDLKLELLSEFFTKCTSSIEYSTVFIQFIEKLAKDNQSILFLEELLKCLGDSLRLRHNKLRGISLPVVYPKYLAFSNQFVNATTSELEELVLQIESLLKQISRSVIKDEYVLANLLLDISRMLRKIK